MSAEAKAGAQRRSGTIAVPGEFAFTFEDFAVIAKTLYDGAGIHVPENKATLVYSRVAKRLRALGLKSFRDYCNLIAGSSGKEERGHMMAAMTTGVTRFFRESH